MTDQKRRNTCLLAAMGILAACLCASLLLGGGGYYLYRTGGLNLNEVLGFVGMGPGEVQISNLSDSTLEMVMTYIDEETGEERSGESVQLAPYDIRILPNLTPREYQIVINSNLGLPPGGECRINLRGGDTVSFVAVPEGVLVYRDGDNVSSSDEVNLLTSPVCQGE
jgi:hypothetical protein